MKKDAKQILFIILLSTVLSAQTEPVSTEDSNSNTVQANPAQKALENNLLINKNIKIDTAHNITGDPTLINDMPSTLEIVTLPESTFVLLNDKLQGKSPLVIKDVTPGKHTIILKKTGYFAKKVTINVPPGIEKKLEFTMEKPSILKITSEPSSSIVYLNKKNVGLTPFISKELKKGSYNLILLKEGYQKSEQNLELEAGTGDSLHIVLKLKPNVNPDTAEAPDTVEAKEELQKKEDTKLRSVLDKIALGIFAGFSLIILLIELSQDN